MQTVTQILNSEIFWTVIVTWAVQWLGTVLVGKIPPTGPVRKTIRALHGLLDRIDPPSAGVALALVAWAALSVCQGCSLEAARNRRLATQSDARMAAPRDSAQCQAWDSIHIWGDWSGGVAGGLAATATSTSLAFDGKTQTGLAVTGVVLGAASTAAFVFADQSAASWAENCQ